MNDNKNEALDWNEILSSDGKDFTLLPEGIYEFEIAGFERGTFPGNKNMCPCNNAKLTLKIQTEQGTSIIYDDLILHKKMEWRLSQFFRCIGLKKRGEKITMNWNAVPGATGKIQIKVETYTDRNGNERKINKVEKYLDYEVTEIPIEKTSRENQSTYDWLKIDENEPDIELPYF